MMMMMMMMNKKENKIGISLYRGAICVLFYYCCCGLISLIVNSVTTFEIRQIVSAGMSYEFTGSRKIWLCVHQSNMVVEEYIMFIFISLRSMLIC
jgi:hypothetical protein